MSTAAHDEGALPIEIPAPMARDATPAPEKRLASRFEHNRADRCPSKGCLPRGFAVCDDCLEVTMTDTIPEGAQLSDDGQYWWDGSAWQPVPGQTGGYTGNADGAPYSGQAGAGASGDDGGGGYEGSSQGAPYTGYDQGPSSSSGAPSHVVLGVEVPANVCDSFWHNFKFCMDGAHMPVPDSLFAELSTALGTIKAIAEAASKCGSAASLEEVIAAAGLGEAYGVAVAGLGLLGSAYVGALVGCVTAAGLSPSSWGLC